MGEAKRRKATGKPSPERLRRERRQQWIWGGSIAAVVAVVALVLYLVTPGTGPSGTLPTADADADPFPSELDRYGVQLGDPDAPVVVREFADYQCPACARFAEVHERLKADYIDQGKVRLVFFEMPLRQHANAIPAALAARCAGDQDAYWDMHNKLFEDQSAWANLSTPLDTFVGYARDLDLNDTRLRRCMTTEFRLDRVEDSQSVAQQLRITSTPTVIVDNIPLTRPGWEQLSGVIDRQLEQAN